MHELTEAAADVDADADGIAISRQALTLGFQGRSLVILITDRPQSDLPPYGISELNEALLTASDSARAYFNEVSYGKSQITADFHGWINVEMDDCDEKSDWLENAVAQLSSDPDFLNRYDHLIGVFEQQAGNCKRRSFATLGLPDGTGRMYIAIWV